MRTRTRLTSPPGEDPTPETVQVVDELYVPGLALPTEPRVPSRWRKPVIVVMVVLLVIGSGYLWLRIARSGQDFDPSLENVEFESPADP